MNMGASYSDINLQTTLAAANPPTDPYPVGHHPIMCREELLWLEEDGRFGCQHTEVPAGDRRTQACIDHSIALLLIEMLRQKEDADVGWNHRSRHRPRRPARHHPRRAAHLVRAEAALAAS